MRHHRLAAGSILAAALVAACGPDWDALDPSLGEAGAGAASGTGSASGGGGCQDDGNACTIDTCDGPVTQHTPVAPGTPCDQGGGNVCSEGGECIECIVASDCPGADEDCRKRTCTAEGTCSLSLVPAGEEVPTQKDGDCKTAVCSGMGVVQNLVTPADIPVDGNDCTSDVCDAAGNPENPSLSAGSPCAGANGAQQCNGSGACVQCNQPSDCGLSSLCVAQACDAMGMCDPTPELDAGAPCGAGMRCDGQGGCVTCQGASVTPLMSIDLPQFVPNNDATGVTSTVLAAGLAKKIVDVDVTVDITGDTSGDLAVSLVSPSGTVIDLTSGNGGLYDDVFGGTTFDDDSPGKRVTEATFINGVAAASLIPERNLGRLNGEDPNGMWELVVKDLGVSGAGSFLTSWSMAITAQEDNLILPSASFQSPNAVATQDGQEVTSPVAVTGVPGVIYEATVTIDLAHKAANQLVITLASPAGKTIPLSTSNGAMDVFKGTTFEDGAASLIGCVGSGCVVFVNNVVVTSAIPEGSLSALVGDDPNGTWTLKVLDTANGQDGVLTSWSLDLTPALCSVTP